MLGALTKSTESPPSGALVRASILCVLGSCHYYWYFEYFQVETLWPLLGSGPCVWQAEAQSTELRAETRRLTSELALRQREVGLPYP